MERLIGLATAFRKAIEASPKNKLPITFSNFPRGACGDATPLLGAFLIAQGFEPFDYMLGERGSSSHAWLQRGNLVVDVTADQFADCDISVIVSGDSAWHRQFDGKRQHVADYRIYDEKTKLILGGAYSVIVANLPSTPNPAVPRTLRDKAAQRR
jgi:hypothetical protein